MAGLEQHVSIFDKQLSFTVLIQLGIKSTKRTFFFSAHTKNHIGWS